MWGRWKRRRPMLDVARNLVRNMLGTRSQHARNTFATRSQHPSLNVARTTVRNMGKALRNIKVFRNILCASQPDRRLIGSPHPNRAAQHPSDASTRIGRPGASSSVFLTNYSRCSALSLYSIHLSKAYFEIWKFHLCKAYLCFYIGKY
jgi:hypothetical protein